MDVCQSLHEDQARAGDDRVVGVSNRRDGEKCLRTIEIGCVNVGVLQFVARESVDIVEEGLKARREQKGADGGVGTRKSMLTSLPRTGCYRSKAREDGDLAVRRHRGS